MFFLLVLVLSSSAVDVAQPYTLNQSKLEWWPTWLSVGTWNTMLQPWFQQEWADNVFNHYENQKFDVLALQEVWTDEDVHKILNHPGRKRHYPYYHVPKARPNDRAGCDFSDATLAYLATNYLQCLVAYGIPTNTLMQPLVPVPIDCMTLAVGIGIEQYNPVNQLCLACLINTLEYLPVATADNGVADQALATCGAGQGPKYGHRGNNGQVILSKHPLTKVSETQFDGFLVNRVNVHATIKGIKFGFGHFAYNVLEDIDASLAPLMYGALQKDHIQDFIDHKSDVVLGDMNSGPNYQPEGYDHFAANHYTQVSPAENTWCKESHKDFLPCPLAGGPPALAIDHVMVRDGSHIYSLWGRQFNEYPIAMSDHVGVAVDLISVKCSEGLTNAIEKIKAEKNRQ